ncbi:hypothetical protein DFJ77DRAFT_2586 [Powellomyces hirtus]|nr:hypothetical protein DFJ77DRAFT_2586 [Powellomyces hirtus]
MTNAETLRQLEVFMTLPMEQRQWQIEYDATLTEIANSSQMHDLQWEQVKELIKFKLHLNVCAAPPNESTPALQLEIIKLLDGFDRAPITLQRICELAVKPDQQYTKIRTYLRALVRSSLYVYGLDFDLIR